MPSSLFDSQTLPSRPQPPRFRFYYGWVNVVMAALAMTATLPGRTHGLGVITTALLEDLRLTEIQYSTINFWAILIGTLLSMPIGILIDRFGTRLVVTAVLAALGASVIGMSRATDVPSLFVFLTLTRGLGQTALSVVSMAIVGKWFTEKSGTAMGVYAMLLSVGSAAAFGALLVEANSSAWRGPWAGMGWILLGGLAPLAWLLVRSNPPEAQALPALETESKGSDKRFTLKEALTSPAFWAFGLATSFFNLVWSAISLYQRELLSDRGFDPKGDTYNLVMGVLFLGGLVSNLLSGWLANRGVSLGQLLLAGMLVLGIGLLAFPAVTTPATAILYGLAMGVGGGPIVVVFFAFWGQAFGRLHLGKIQAAAQVLTVFASASGPWLLSECKVITNSYLPFFEISAVIVAILAVGAWLAPLPRRDRE